jgi:hypothetical protein
VDKRPTDIVVFSIVKPGQCRACGRGIEPGEFLRIEKEQPLCIGCADLDHLVYLPSGDTALTRRSRRYSTLSAVVLRFSRARKRYERQGILVEEEALEKAEHECLADEEQRARARARAALVRERIDAEYVRAFGERIAEQYPSCPKDEAEKIAQHACRKHSGRVGRSAAARQFDGDAIALAVAAHVRHRHSSYDTLLAQGWDRGDARRAVASAVGEVLDRWSRRDAGSAGNTG